MAFEVDFLPVGDGERSGDAICVRFGNLTGPRDQQTVCVIDGGTKESGAKLVEHIKLHYQTEHVNYVFSTHPDSDHASGLSVVMESLSCGALVMHRPWEHSDDICHLFDDPKITPEKLAGRMERNLLAAHNLEELANKKGISIIEPFAGVATTDREILVLGPTENYYQSLLPTFRDMPELATQESLVAKIGHAVQDAVTWVAETMHIETLVDPPPAEVSAENNSSAIILFQIDGHRLLLTGDAGTEGLNNAINYATSQGISLKGVRFFQVPHHGSRRNIGPTVLDQIMPQTAFISASIEGAPKHPSKRVTNALVRRGAKVYCTQGSTIMHGFGHPRNWGPAIEVPFYHQVED